ncbi:hypothetical protein [Pseudomonas sp. LFM046]|uniref:hypothetical protein n=1 Tax=Pseudomonas sp. LFM046 TaxID=1608357 RepID=UPI0005CFC394|nr:hypothetical protein [Pseudomonas sp. LFM046]
MLTRLTFTDADLLDPISVPLEDFGDRTAALEHNPMGHADEEMTTYYQAGHKEKEVELRRVKAGLRL